MEQNKHTQWEYDVCDFGGGKIEYGIFDPATHFQGDTVTYIATVHDAGNESHARLFTAAPDMLAALETIANSEQYDGDSFVCDFYTLQSVARAAIARAKGES